MLNEVKHPLTVQKRSFASLVTYSERAEGVKGCRDRREHKTSVSFAFLAIDLTS